MLFHKYLETILGSKIKVNILRVLIRFSSKNFTSRELARQIKASHTAVLKSLPDLQGMNIITIEKHGKSNLIKINTESIFYNKIKELFDFESKTINELVKELEKLPLKANTIALFGSIASKQEKINSDIDLLIITNNKNMANEIIANKQTLFTNKFGKIISSYLMTRSEFSKKRNSKFIQGIINNHILVKGDEL